MEQEQVVAQLGRATLVTGEVLLKGLFLVCSKAVEIYQFKGENTHFTGEADWNKFMATADTKEVQQLLQNEVNLEAVRKELGQYGIGFSFYTHPDGKTTLASTLSSCNALGSDPITSPSPPTLTKGAASAATNNTFIFVISLFVIYHKYISTQKG